MNMEPEQRKRPTIRVMIVENNQLILWGLGKLIDEQRPCMDVIETACSQEDAAKRVLAAAPDVVLLRYELACPDANDGLILDFTGRGCRVLLMMDELTQESLQIALRCGVHGFLTRKSTAEEVIKAIEKTCAGELWFGREAVGMALDALREPRRHSDPVDEEFDTLTPRERKVVSAAVEHRVRTNKDLARQLFISESTLRNHLSSIYQKLGVANRLGLYVYAQAKGIAATQSRVLV